MDEIVNCSTCEFFEKLPSRDVSKDSNGGIGNCLVNPPQIFYSEKITIRMNKKEEGKEVYVTIDKKRAVGQYPMLLGNMVCGLHPNWDKRNKS